GCGKQLIRCFPSIELADSVKRSLLAEVKNTIGGVIASGRPLSDAFTSNATFRDGLAEGEYQRWRLEAGEIAEFPDLSRWPRDGKLAPRYESKPGQHAGVLTTRQ